MHILHDAYNTYARGHTHQKSATPLNTQALVSLEAKLVVLGPFTS